MNRHVERVEARDRRNRLDRFLAACVTALFIGLCAGQVRAQDIAIGAGNGGAGFPTGSIPLVESATGTTAGATATLPGLTNHFTYLCGFSVSPGAATAAITITVTTTGLTNNFTWNVGAPVAAAGTTAAILTINFPTCIPAGTINTPITVVAGALGAGGVGQDVNAWGFQQ